MQRIEPIARRHPQIVKLLAASRASSLALDGNAGLQNETSKGAVVAPRPEGTRGNLRSTVFYLTKSRSYP
jgi:hypothetical protein